VFRNCAPQAQDFTHQKGSRHRRLTDAKKERQPYKSRVRAKVEHPIGMIKWVFAFAKVRYRGVAKNAVQLYAAWALANLFIARRQQLRLAYEQPFARQSTHKTAIYVPNDPNITRLQGLI
jgi:hypothetical protein